MSLDARTRLDAKAARWLDRIDVIRAVACLPLAGIVRWSDARPLVVGDVAHWLEVLVPSGYVSGAGPAVDAVPPTPSSRGTVPAGDVKAVEGQAGVPGLHRLLYAFPEFRSLYYHRLSGGNPLGALLGRLMRPFFKPVEGLSLLTKDIGPGLFLAHGTSTVLSADRIGRNCYVHQNVTVGWDYKSEGKPVIGDGVFIGTGAVILGAVTVGDFARIGANAVVLSDVPAFATAVGAPARVRPPQPTEAPEPAGQQATGVAAASA